MIRDARYPNTPFQRYLFELGACAAARDFVWDKTIEKTFRCQTPRSYDTRTLHSRWFWWLIRMHEHPDVVQQYSLTHLSMRPRYLAENRRFVRKHMGIPSIRKGNLVWRKKKGEPWKRHTGSVSS